MLASKLELDKVAGVQLPALGAEITSTLTKAQADCLVPVHGPFKPNSDGH